MSVPLPTDDEVLLVPPDAAEANATARAIAAIVAPAGGLTDLQRVLLHALFAGMTGHEVDLDDLDPASPETLAAVLAHRNLAFRTRGVQVMLLVALVLRPLPREVVDRVAATAAELGVEEGHGRGRPRLRQRRPRPGRLRLQPQRLHGRLASRGRQRFHVQPKSPGAIVAGSVGPWEPGGISPFQVRTGRTLAEREGRPYDAFGASPS
jgi:hypothetical protein